MFDLISTTTLIQIYQVLFRMQISFRFLICSHSTGEMSSQKLNWIKTTFQQAGNSKRLVQPNQWYKSINICVQKGNFNIYMYVHVSLALTLIIEPVHEISDNFARVTSKASDQPAHSRSLIRAFASRLSIL